VDLAAGGSVQGLTTAIGRVLNEVPSDAHLIPGHGPLSTVDELRDYKRMLEETVAIVEGRIAANQSLEEVTAAGLPEEWAAWGTGFMNTERWLGTVYQSLTGGAGGGQANASDAADRTRHAVDASHGGNYGQRGGSGHDHDH
jgi:hypothetical protein